MLPLLALFVQTLDKGPCPIAGMDSLGSHVWLFCERSRILISHDAGATWRNSRVPTEARLRAVEILDERRGFVVGDEGTLLASSDGGETWRQVAIPSKENLMALHFRGDKGWVVGWGGTILHTADAGVSWQLQKSATTLALEGVHFADEKHGVAVGWNGTIVRTEDGGAHWERIVADAAAWSLHSVWLRDARHGWAVGALGQLLRTRDGGLTWQAQETPVKGSFRSVVFDSAGRGWVSADRAVLVSEDGGETWRSQDLGSWVFLEQMVAVKDTLWAVGPFGVLTRGQNAAWSRLQTLPAGS